MISCVSEHYPEVQILMGKLKLLTLEQELIYWTALDCAGAPNEVLSKRTTVNLTVLHLRVEEEDASALAEFPERWKC